MPTIIDQRTSAAVTARSRSVLVVGAVLVLTVCTVFATTQLPAGAATRAGVRRVLIVSLPGVAWPDLEGADVPNLTRLFGQSALGALVTRTAERRTSAGGGYSRLEREVVPTATISSSARRSSRRKQRARGDRHGLYKTEVICGPGQGPSKTVEEVELATLGRVHWHNTERLHGYLDDVPPIEFETAHYAAPAATTEAA